jgi:predicted DNA-binding transcriptional regulator AlpA
VGTLLTEAEVAEKLRVSLACLRRWRLEKRGPRFIKVGVLVRYPAEGLDQWFDSLPIGGSSSQAADKRAAPLKR